MLSLFSSSGMLHETSKLRDCTATTVSSRTWFGKATDTAWITRSALHSEGPRLFHARERNTYVVPSERSLSAYVRSVRFSCSTMSPACPSCSS